MKENLEISGIGETLKQNPQPTNFQQLSEDNVSKDPWVRTRMCFCSPSDPTDCRFHSPSEPGWDVCPNLARAEQDSKILGRWLWAKSIAGKQKKAEEPKEVEVKAA